MRVTPEEIAYLGAIAPQAMTGEGSDNLTCDVGFGNDDLRDMAMRKIASARCASQ